MNPLVVLSEVEYEVLSILHPKSKKDFKRMQELIHELGNRNQEELIERHFNGTIETIRSNYHKFLVDYLMENGVQFKSDKKLKDLLHEQEVQRYLREHEEKRKTEDENAEPNVIDAAKVFARKKTPF